MFTIPTRQKLKIASLIYRSVASFRALTNQDTKRALCTRGGLTWDLDLTEGIDLSIYVFGRFESQTSKVLRNLVQSGMTVFDIGANIGAHALPLAQIVGPHGKVYAFEPTDWAFQRLEQNKKLNAKIEKNLIPIKVALSDGKQTIPDGFSASWNVLSYQEEPTVHGGRHCAATATPSTTIDEFVKTNEINRLDFIKIDVDGFEPFIIRGAEKTLARFRPSILLELCPYILEEHKSSLHELMNLLSGLNYTLYNESGRNRLPFLTEALLRKIPAGGSINALAVYSA